MVQAIASVESEMEQHLKDGSCSGIIGVPSLIPCKVRKQLHRPGLTWVTVSGIDVGSRLLRFTTC